MTTSNALRMGAACLAACLLLAGCGKESFSSTTITPETTSVPQAGQSTAASAASQPDGIPWLVQPDSSIEWVQSLADYPLNTVNPMDHREELYLFHRDGKTGVVDLNGVVVIPESEDVHWCAVCGLTNDDESKVFDRSGKVTGAGGHGSETVTFQYDETSGQLYYLDYGEYQPWSSSLSGSGSFMAPIVKVSRRTLAQGEDVGEPYRVNADGTLTALQVEETGKYLQADSMTGKPLNQQRYQDYKLCKSGLFPVKVDGLWGYVDEDGEMQIHCKYDNVLPFDTGIAAVRMNGKWNYINLADVYQTNLGFDEAATACDGKAWVKSVNGWGVVALADCKQ